MRLFFSILAFLVLAGCSQVARNDGYVIGFSQCLGDDAWRKSMNAEMRRAVSLNSQLSLDVRVAEGNSQTQIAQIRELIDSGVDLLIVSPFEKEPLTPIVEEVYEMGIPVIILDRETASPVYSAYVGANNYQIGLTAGNYIVNLANDQPINVLELWGVTGSSPAIDRHSGFIEKAARAENLNVIEYKTAFSDDTDDERFQAAINAYIDSLSTPVDVVYAHTDQIAYWARRAFEQKDPDNAVKFIGVDALPGPTGGMQLVHDGLLTASMLYPTGGEEAITLAVDILEGRPFTKDNRLETTVIDASNVEIMMLQTSKILSQQGTIERQQTVLTEQTRLYRSQRNVLYFIVGLFVLSLVLAIFLVYLLKEKQRRNKDLRAKNEQIVQQKEELELATTRAKEATQAKFRFFTNISHEFRTPLTLILGPVEDLIASGRESSRNLRDLLLVRKNARRLLRLINQLMDFRKLDNQRLSVSVSPVNVYDFLEEVTQSFSQLAREQEIDLQLIRNSEKAEIWLDPNMMDKVFFNLLSNAFKFVKPGCFIHLLVNFDETNQEFVIQVKDNGRGMSVDQQNQIFERFYQGEHGLQGTGLGLALSKELLELHQGSITVSSRPWQETTFEVRLKAGSTHFEADQLPISGERSVKKEELYDVTDFVKLPQLESDGEQVKNNSILLLEDDEDLLSYLIKTFDAEYEVRYQNDGLKGLELAFEIIPDIILCDLILPGMDGYGIIERIKTDVRTSHIPVVLLTGKSHEDAKLRGLKAGADLYVTKPFSIEYLKESIKAQLRNRELLKEFYLANESEALEVAEVGHSKKDLDKQFVQRFKKTLSDNLSNAQFKTEDICQEFGLSRVQLYRKVKALLGCGVHDYLMDMRLTKAQRMLRNTTATISEIAYEVGFSSPAYFSTAFKTRFHLSPSEFKNR